jgi:hypothetical protein
MAIVFNLEERKADLDLYLSTIEADKASILENWLSVATYKTFIPSSTKTMERQLYTAEIEGLIALLKSENGAAGPHRGA